MFRLTLKGLVANWLRFALTAFAIVLAVSFVVSSFVLTDGLRSTFNDVSAEVAAGIDYELRPVDEFGAPEQLDQSLLADVAAVDGVEQATPIVAAADNTILPIKPDGETITSSGPPQVTFGWAGPDGPPQFSLVEGEPPVEAGDLVMDRDAAAKHGFEIGGTYGLVTPPGRTEFTLTGLVSFGEENATAGATLMLIPVEHHLELTDLTGYDSISVALSPDADPAAVETALAGLADGTEVVDGATIEAEQQADFNQNIDIIGYGLLGFAGVSLFVSIFIIYNTFAIVLGQRTSELALLRTIGADPAQLRRSVLAEAGVMGVAASLIGIGTGVAVAFGLRGLFGLLGAEIPGMPLMVSPRTIVVACAVGIGVTLVSALAPARKASRVPPIAALRDGAAAATASHWTRLAIGLGVLALGITGTVLGLSGAASIWFLVVGAALVFIGITLTSPLITEPFTRALGWPLATTSGLPGRLAQQNAGRNPHRTATTAAALMIGLALVSMALVVGQSFKTQITSSLTDSTQADYMLFGNETSLPRPLVDDLAALPESEAVISYHYDEVIVADQEAPRVVSATDLEAASSVFDFGISEGTAWTAAATDPVLVLDTEAEAEGLSVGDTMPITFASGAVHDLTVIGLYSDGFWADATYLLDESTWTAAGADPADQFVTITLAEGVTVTDADPAITALTAQYPQVEVNTSDEMVQMVSSAIDQMLVAINVLVGLAVVIALIGIANTLALSVLERTRELGLLRAVGMSRRQLRRMVRLEACLVAVFGAGLGVAAGIAFGWGAVVALPSEVASSLSIPAARIAILVAVAGLAGLVAAWGPARRASRLDVLDAIAQ